MSFPNMKIINDTSITNPTIWAFSSALSLNGLPLTNSINKKKTCPPSKAGIGKIFIKANIIDKRAVKLQNDSQSQTVPNMVAIWNGPDKDSVGSNLPLNIWPKALTVSVTEPNAVETA